VASDYGLKLSQGGFDALTCPDYKLVFNSSWPLLKIIHQDSFILDNNPQVIYVHEQEHPIMFLVWEATSTGWRLANNDIYGFRVNDSVFKVLGGGGINAIRYMLFDVDLTKAYTAPNEFTQVDTEVAIRDNDFGIRITKDGVDDSSKDFRDYVVHSGCQSPMLHSVSLHTKQDVSPETFNIEHGMGHAPMAFVYSKLAGTTDYKFANTGPESGSGVSIASNDTSVLVTVTGTLDTSTVILKDPIFIP
jgi:hypothetical protein